MISFRSAWRLSICSISILNWLQPIARSLFGNAFFSLAANRSNALMQSSGLPARIRCMWLAINSNVSITTPLHKCTPAARHHIPVMKSLSQQNMFCILVPSVYTCQYGPWLIYILSQILSFSEKLRAPKSFFIYFVFNRPCNFQKNAYFLGS